MRPYVWEVYDHARNHANDNDKTVGGRIYHNRMLEPFYKEAYREYFRVAAKYDAPISEGRAFFNLPANTSVLEPLDYGISNFNAPSRVEVRPAQTTVSGVTITLGTPVSVESTGHGLSSGSQVILSGLPATSDVVDLNGAWSVTVTDANNFTLNGSRFPNSTSAVTGTYTTSSGGFSQIPMVARVSDIGPSAVGLSHFAFTRNRLMFPPSSQAYQLQVWYDASGDAPTLLHQEVPIDDSLDYLSMRTIGLAMQSRGDKRADAFNLQAVGPRWISEGIAGGQLGDLLHGQVRATQAIYRRRRPFRTRRNHPFDDF